MQNQRAGRLAPGHHVTLGQAHLPVAPDSSLIKLQAGSGSLSPQPDNPWSHLLKGSHMKKPGETDNTELGGWGRGGGGERDVEWGDREEEGRIGRDSVSRPSAHAPQGQPLKISMEPLEPPKHRLQITNLTYLDRPLK